MRRYNPIRQMGSYAWLNYKRKFILACLALLTCFAIMSGDVLSQPSTIQQPHRKPPTTSNPSPNSKGRGISTLYLTIKKQGKADVAFSFYSPAVTDTTAIQQAVEKTLGCNLSKLSPSTELDEELSTNSKQNTSIAPKQSTATDSSDSFTSAASYYLRLSGQCPATFTKQGWLIKGELQVNPLLKLMQNVQVEKLYLYISHPKTDFVKATEDIPKRTQLKSSSASSTGWQRRTSYHTYNLSTSKQYGPIQLEFGYRNEDVALAAMPAITIIFIPVGLIFWMRRTALHKQDIDPTAAWFGYTRGLSWVLLGTWIVWVGLYATLNIRNFLDFSFSEDLSPLLKESIKFCIFLFFPASVGVISQALSYPVYARVRGMTWTRADLIRQSIVTQAAAYIPLGLIFLVVLALAEGNFQVAIGAGVAAYLSRLFLAMWSAQAQDLKLNAITIGELRDRAFSLAEKAGVKLQQLYVLPAGKSQMVNAFATSGNTILLSDYLLQKLTKSEVDAIIAHELGHLKHNHPQKLARTLIFAVVGIVILGAVLTSAGSLLPIFLSARALAPESSQITQQLEEIGKILSYPPVLLVVSLLIFLYVSRQYESVADRESVNLAGNAEGSITSLVKLTRLNFTPLEWGGWQEKFITHPSTMKRVEAIAAYGQVSEIKLQELLQEPSPIQTQNNQNNDEYYTLPKVLINDEPIFSSQFKRESVLHNWTLLLAIEILPAIAIAWLAKLAPFGADWNWMIYLGGLGMVIAIYLWLGNFIAVRGYGGLKTKLSQRWQQQGIDIETLQAEFVSLAPHLRLHLYEGFSDWDIGFLSLVESSLYYLGENVQFTLYPDQITSLELTKGSPSWWSLPHINITWHDRTTDDSGVFSLWANSRGSMTNAGKATLDLYQRLQTWQQGQIIPTQWQESLPELSHPQIGNVTSIPLNEALTLKTFSTTVILNSMIAITLSSLFQLSFLGGLYVVAVVIAVAIFQRIPFALQNK